ncbi:MAG: thiamine diphosphokinase [Eubacterium sp.]|nr:thiamine diphosphokinase [Eubacterium sp.]
MAGKQRILIVSGGQIEDAFVTALLEENKYHMTIACDRGMTYFKRSGRLPDLILGDFDSANAAELEYFQTQTDVKIEQFPKEKDWTDTELAVRRALELSPMQIDLVGATGSRLDHVLGNVQLLALGLEHKTTIYLLDAHNRIRLVDGPIAIKKTEQFGDYISLIPYAGAVQQVTLRGMKYPLDQATLTPDITLGISNEIVEETAYITFADGKLLVMETKD